VWNCTFDCYFIVTGLLQSISGLIASCQTGTPAPISPQPWPSPVAPALPQAAPPPRPSHIALPKSLTNVTVGCIYIFGFTIDSSSLPHRKWPERGLLQDITHPGILLRNVKNRAGARQRPKRPAFSGCSMEGRFSPASRQGHSALHSIPADAQRLAVKPGLLYSMCNIQSSRINL
jgi:hypothetical protein